VKNSTGHQLIRSEQINENPSPGTVELFDGANQEVSVELISAAKVHDMNSVNALAVGCAVELYQAVTDVLV